MGLPLFLAQTGATQTVMPPGRWREAFQGGQAVDWMTLLRVVQAGDSVWVPVEHRQWPTQVADLLRHQPACRIVVLSAVPEDAEGLRAIDAGASGYCHLFALPELLREVEQVVRLGGLWVGPALVRRLAAATRELLQRSPVGALAEPDLSSLTERETQVARAVAEGQSNREVADQLHISERTVKAHLGSVFEKLGVRDRVQLVLRLARDIPSAD